MKFEKGAIISIYSDAHSLFLGLRITFVMEKKVEKKQKKLYPVKDGDDHDQEDHIIEYHEHVRDTKTQKQLFFFQTKIFKPSLLLNFFFKFIS